MNIIFYSPTSKHLDLKRNAISFGVAVVFLALILSLKFELSPENINHYKVLELDLVKEVLPPEPVEIVKEEVKQPEVVVETEQSKPVVEPKQIQPKIDVISNQAKDVEPKTETQIPDSGVILDSFYSGLSKQQEVPKEFQKAFKENEDFIYFEVSEPDWNNVTKFIDEELDKPRTHMNFYSIGFKGKVERAFDKITYTKTFRTKYGTEITCGLVGVFAACSWK